MLPEFSEHITEDTKLLLGDWVCGRINPREAEGCFRLGVWFGEAKSWGLFKDGVDPNVSGGVTLRMAQAALISSGFTKGKDRLQWMFPNKAVYLAVGSGEKPTLVEVSPGADPLAPTP